MIANTSASGTNPIDACQPIGFTVKGGTMPYSITLAALNQSVTNATLGADTGLTWFNTANTDSEFIGKLGLNLYQWY